MPSAPGFEILPDAYAVVHDHDLTTSAMEEVWGVLHNDTGATSVSAVNGDTSAIGQATTLASGATLTMYADGGFFYVPLAGSAYIDQFSYSAIEGGESASEQVTISVTNAVPIAYATSLSTRHDQDLRIYPEQIAWDDDFDTLLLDVVSAPAAGLLAENEDGTFTYTPLAGWAGSTTLIVRASDGLATSNDAVLTIDVTNSAPVATADVYYLHAGLVLSLDATDGLMHNDYDSDWDHLVAEFVGAWPTSGVLTFTPDGAMTFDSDDVDVGDVIFEYRLFDGVTYSGAVSVTIHVENQTPQGTPEEFDVWYEQAISGNVLENDWDDDHDELTVSLLSGPAYHESFTLWADGTFAYEFSAEPLTFVLQDTFTYRIFDGTAYSAPIEVKLWFTNVPLAKDDSYVLDEAGSLTVSASEGVLANEFNPMGLTLTAALPEQFDPSLPGQIDPSVGELEFNPDGTFTFTAESELQSPLEFTYHTLAIVNNQPIIIDHGIVQIVTTMLLRGSIGLRSVAFQGNARIQADASDTPFDNLQWFDANADGVIQSGTDVQAPVSVTRGRAITLSVRLKIAPEFVRIWQALEDNIRIRATGTNGINIGFDEARPVYGLIVSRNQESHLCMFRPDRDGRLQRTLPLDVGLPNYSNYYPSFDLSWEISAGRGQALTWFSPLVSNTSRNELFVTLENPRGSADSDAQPPTIKHTVFYAGRLGAGSTNANTETPAWNDTTNLVKNVFLGFRSRSVTRADGQAMKYYGQWDTPHGTVDALIQHRDGQCTAWASFFIDVLRAQGGNFSYAAHKRSIVGGAPGVDGFMVKNWSFNTAPAPMTGRVAPYTHSNELSAPSFFGAPIRSVKGVWEYATWVETRTAAQFREVTGIPGQNSPNPLSTFTSHCLVKIGNTLYDPSYGVTHLYADNNRLGDFQANAIAGVYSSHQDPVTRRWYMLARTLAPNEMNQLFAI